MGEGEGGIRRKEDRREGKGKGEGGSVQLCIDVHVCIL